MLQRVWLCYRVWLCLNIHLIFRLHEEMLQREDAENTLRGFRQVHLHMFRETTTVFYMYSWTWCLIGCYCSHDYNVISQCLQDPTDCLPHNTRVSAGLVKLPCSPASDLDTKLKRKLCLRAGNSWQSKLLYVWEGLVLTRVHWGLMDTEERVCVCVCVCVCFKWCLALPAAALQTVSSRRAIVIHFSQE